MGVEWWQLLSDTGLERMEINVDAMDTRTLMELDRYVRDKVGAKSVPMGTSSHPGGMVSSKGRVSKKSKKVSKNHKDQTREGYHSVITTGDVSANERIFNATTLHYRRYAL